MTNLERWAIRNVARKLRGCAAKIASLQPASQIAVVLDSTAIRLLATLDREDPPALPPPPRFQRPPV